MKNGRFYSGYNSREQSSLGHCRRLAATMITYSPDSAPLHPRKSSQTYATCS
ncbi:hypothetical protein ACP4OV_027151 [Aristida adscensionis]